MIEHSPGDGSVVRSWNRYAVDQALYPSVVVRRPHRTASPLRSDKPRVSVVWNRGLTIDGERSPTTTDWISFRQMCTVGRATRTLEDGCGFPPSAASTVGCAPCAVVVERQPANLESREGIRPTSLDRSTGDLDSRDSEMTSSVRHDRWNDGAADSPGVCESRIPSYRRKVLRLVRPRRGSRALPRAPVVLRRIGHRLEGGDQGRERTLQSDALWSTAG